MVAANPTWSHPFTDRGGGTAVWGLRREREKKKVLIKKIGFDSWGHVAINRKGLLIVASCSKTRDAEILESLKHCSITSAEAIAASGSAVCFAQLNRRE